MNMASGQQEWITDAFRVAARKQMDEAFARVPNPFNKTNEELEKQIYENCQNSKQKYSALVNRVIAMKQRQNQQGQAGGMQTSHGMMRPPMQPAQPAMPGQPMQGVRNIASVPPMPRGPPSDSPVNMNMQSPLSSGGVTGYSPDNRILHPSPGSQFYGQRPQMQGRQPQQLQQPPSQPQLKMPDSNYSSSMHGSIGSTYIPSLSPAHPSNSPQLSAMSPALRTPQSVSVAHSPAGITVPSPSTNQVQNDQNKTEEQLYMEKLKQLQKYIDPLSRMINKEKNSKDKSKMKSLRDILIDPSKRLAMTTLLKCEKVLQNWSDVKSEPTPPPSRPDQHMCQPILDAVASASKSPMLNHTLKRTFGPALQVLNGDYYIPESVCTKRARLRIPSEESDYEPGIRIPNVVQGEIARLGSKFKVTVDQSQSTNCGMLHLICRLDIASLPSVPPIRIIVPNTYPKEGPQWQCFNSEDTDDDAEFFPESAETSDNETKRTKFLSTFQPKMKTHINQALKHNETISAVLTAWERSVKETVASQITVSS